MNRARLKKGIVVKKFDPATGEFTDVDSTDKSASSQPSSSDPFYDFGDGSDFIDAMFGGVGTPGTPVQNQKDEVVTRLLNQAVQIAQQKKLHWCYTLTPPVSRSNKRSPAKIEGQIINHLIKTFSKQHGIRLGKDKLASQRLKEAGERACMDLAFSQHCVVNLPFIWADERGPYHINHKLDGNKFGFRDSKSQSPNWIQLTSFWLNMSYPNSVDPIKQLASSKIRIPPGLELDSWEPKLQLTFDHNEVATIEEVARFVVDYVTHVLKEFAPLETWSVEEMDMGG